MALKKSREGGDIRQPDPRILLTDLRQLIAEARQDVARQVNSALVMLYCLPRSSVKEKILHTLCAKLSWSHFPSIRRQKK